MKEATYSYAWLRNELDHYSFIFDKDPCASRKAADARLIITRRDKVAQKAAAAAAAACTA